MTAETESDLQIKIAHVLTMDLVGYSKLLITEQTSVMSDLARIVKDTARFRRADAEGKMIRIPTGDGMLLVFFDDPQAPIECAAEIARTLKTRPDLRMRMGIHSGPVNEIVDVADRSNMAGAGIDIAQRVMDCGDAGHILLSKRVAEDLAPFPRWNASLHDLGEYEVKHGRKISLVNFYTDEIGNPARPTKCGSQARARLRFPVPGGPGSRRALLVGGTLLATMLAVAAAFFFQRGQVSEHSIAVLPFENATNDPNTEYLAEGISEALINSLAELKQLRVIARATAFRYKDKGIDQVRRDLEVTEVLTGSVRQVQDALSVQVDLVDAKSGRQLWGGEYNRKMADLISIKQAIAHEVAEKLKGQLSSDEMRNLVKRDSASPEAYQAYLRGRYFWNKRTADGNTQAFQQFREATEHDPNFALSYVGLADCYISLTFYNFAAPHETMPKAEESVLKALALDEGVAEAHTSLGNILVNYDWNWAEAEREFKRGLELRPDYAQAHQWYAMHFLTPTGRLEEALAEMKKALELEPASLVMNTFMGATLIHLRRYEEAVEQCRKTVAMDPSFAVGHWHLARAYVQMRKFDDAIEESRKAVDLSGGSPLMIAALGHALAKAGKRDQANEILGQLTALSSQRYSSSYEVAAIHAALGDKERAWEFLEKAYAEHSFHLVQLNVSHDFEPLRSDPRFQDLVRRIGLSP